MADPAPEQLGFAEKVENATNSLGFLSYLFHPDQPSFDKYSGEYPEGLSKSLSGLMEVANMLDMGGNIASMIDMNKIANTLTEAHVLTILDNLNDSTKFAEVYENESMKAIIAKIALPLITRGMDTLTLDAALKAASMDQIDLSAFKDGDTSLSSIKIGDLNEEIIATHVSSLSNNNGATLAFLNSLPDEQKNAFLTQLATGENGESLVLKDTEGNPLNMAQVTIEQAIEARARVEISSIGLSPQGAVSLFNFAAGYLGGSTDYGLDGARQGVYDEIRESIPAAFMKIINENKKDPQLPKDPKDIFTMLRAQLADRTNGGGRAEITKLISDNMATIREELKKAENVTFLVQFMPDDLQTGAMAQGLRDFLQENGFLQPIISAIQAFLPFISNMLRGFGLDGAAEKLEGALDVTKMQQDGTTGAFNDTNRPDAARQPTTEVIPTPVEVTPTR